MGERVEANAEDLVPIKNHLPPELTAVLKTRKQWEELGFTVREAAKKYFLHPSSMSRKVFVYYHEEDVLGIEEEPLYPGYKARLIRDFKRGRRSRRAYHPEASPRTGRGGKPRSPHQKPAPRRGEGCVQDLQSMELGYKPDELAAPTRMRPSKGRKPCSYYKKSDVIPIYDTELRNCVTCSIRGNSCFCPLAGDKIGNRKICSEWEPRYTDTSTS